MTFALWVYAFAWSIGLNNKALLKGRNPRNDLHFFSFKNMKPLYQRNPSMINVILRSNIHHVISLFKK